MFTAETFSGDHPDTMHRDDLECAIGDLICDLLHFARQNRALIPGAPCSKPAATSDLNCWRRGCKHESLATINPFFAARSPGVSQSPRPRSSSHGIRQAAASLRSPPARCRS